VTVFLICKESGSVGKTRHVIATFFSTDEPNTTEIINMQKLQGKEYLKYK